MILAIETSSEICSVAFWENGKILREYNQKAPMQHAQLLGKLVEHGLKQLALNQLQTVAVGIGPGSFTGLRIGLSYAQGLCFGSGIHIVGISNHQVIAMQNKTNKAPILTIIDARRDEVYLARHKNDSIFTIESHQIIALDKIEHIFEKGAVLNAFDDLKISDSVTKNLTSKNITINKEGTYNAGWIARLAEQKLVIKGADNLETLEPMYIRPFAGIK